MRPHVVMVPIFAAGHCTPFLLFAKRLASAGVSVTFVSSDKHTSELVGRHSQSVQQLPIRFLGLRDGAEHQSHFELFMERNTPAGRGKAVELLVKLITEMKDSEEGFPVCVVHDKDACWVQEAAQELKIEKHLLYVSPAACLTIGLQSERLVREGRVPVTPATQDIPIMDIPGLPPLQPVDLPSLYLFAETWAWINYNEYGYRKADVVLSNSFYDLEHQVFDAVRTKVIGTPGVQIKYLFDIGPLLPESATTKTSPNQHEHHAVEERDPCILWLNTQKPSSVLYVCIGSHSTHQAPQLLEMAMALEASGQPFLWIVRPPGSEPIDDTAAGAASPSMTEYLPLGFEERIKGRGMWFSGWAPQRRILNHVAIGGFLSHCGWNSVLDSVCAGVPMLTWPFYADQNISNRFLVDTARVAMELEREPIDPEQDLGEHGRIIRRVRKAEIEKKVCRLMQEEEGRILRRNMQTMKGNAQRALAPGGSSRKNFENYVGMLSAKASAAASSHLGRRTMNLEVLSQG